MQSPFKAPEIYRPASINISYTSIKRADVLQRDAPTQSIYIKYISAQSHGSLNACQGHSISIKHCIAWYTRSKTDKMQHWTWNRALFRESVSDLMMKDTEADKSLLINIHVRTQTSHKPKLWLRSELDGVSVFLAQGLVFLREEGLPLQTRAAHLQDQRETPQHHQNQH